MNLEFNLNGNLEIKVKVSDYKRSRPAPACSNPSSPSYGDPGDDPEWSGCEFYLVMGNEEIKIEDDKINEYLEDLFIDDIVEKGENEN